MEPFLPPEYDLHRIRAALSQGVPLRIQREGRPLTPYFVQVDGPETILHCTTMHEYTGVDYAVTVPLDAPTWATLMAQLPG